MIIEIFRVETEDGIVIHLLQGVSESQHLILPHKYYGSSDKEYIQYSSLTN